MRSGGGGLSGTSGVLLFNDLVMPGEPLDKSETPVYRNDVYNMIQAYSKKDGAEAATRKFVLSTLQRSAGRSSEVAWITWDGLEYDSGFKWVPKL